MRRLTATEGNENTRQRRRLTVQSMAEPAATPPERSSLSAIIVAAPEPLAACHSSRMESVSESSVTVIEYLNALGREAER